ncbi:MAG TPA: hypothetical protein P5572_20425, partial [Phycisphaerae bacterium]|nr:hypothetical protein [Phycisphaerae bacterium]
MGMMTVGFDAGAWGVVGTVVVLLVAYFVVIPLIVASKFWLAAEPIIVPLGRPEPGIPPTLPMPPPRVECFFRLVE